MIRTIQILSWLTLFVCLCCTAGLIASYSGSGNGYASYWSITSQTPEGFQTILFSIIWLSIMSLSCLYLIHRVRVFENAAKKLKAK